MSPGVLADIVVAVHAAYVAFVVFGLLAIWVGWWRGWRWTTHRAFRVLHLIMILVVAGEAIADVPCPLTVWERDLREQAGQPLDGESFMGRLLHGLLFYQAPAHVLTIGYVVYALLVVLSLWWIPPRWRDG